jgi:hypothetical protein
VSASEQHRDDPAHFSTPGGEATTGNKSLQVWHRGLLLSS